MRGRLISSKSDERIFVGLIVVGFIAAAAAKQAHILPLGDFSDEAQAKRLHGGRTRARRLKKA